MLEFTLVDVPRLFPTRCLLCGNSKGPILDTMQEYADIRIYVCKLCAERMARQYGFAPGEELERLRGAREAADEAEKTRQSLIQERTDLRTDLSMANTVLLGKNQEIERLRAKVATLENTIQTFQENINALSGVRVKAHTDEADVAPVGKDAIGA